MSGISDEQILEVLEKILGVKRSALSLEMIVQDRGSNLSGGEKQGIALARAVIFDPEILLLDEPSSAMDDEVEKNMIALLTGFDKKKTMVIVTHKVALLMVCTRVIVMDGGKIIWDGPTDQYLDMLKSKEMKKKFNIQGHYLTISLVMAIIVIFLVWANNTGLDLITKGNGRIITAGQNKIVRPLQRNSKFHRG